MSFDRVLPKPAALHYEAPQVSLPRQTSNLLEHKIMSDDVSSKFIMDPIMPQVHLSNINRAKLAYNKMVSSAPIDSSKLVAAPLLTKELSIRERKSQSDRSSSSSPVKSTVSRGEPVAAQFCLCQPDPKIPRPRNAFILYRQHYQSAVVAQNPGLANPDISKIIGEQWRKLPQETKDEWKALAEEEKARHQQQYPEYRYQPRRYGRDGNSRAASSGISHNPPGSTTCSRCGGRIMNPPISPETPFTPNPASNLHNSPHPDLLTGPSYVNRYKPEKPQNPVRLGSNGEPRPPRSRHWVESANGSHSPDSKRRRLNSQTTLKTNPRDRSPDMPYPMSPYPSRHDGAHSRGGPVQLQPPKRFQEVHHEFSLKLPPLQTTAQTPQTLTTVNPNPFSQSASNLETTVMGIPFLNKIRLLAKISPPLEPSFRDGNSPRGTVIAVEGQDSIQVRNAVEYLHHALQKEGKYNVRVFDGPEIRPRKVSSDSGQMGDATVDYLNTISAWHRISEEIIKFVKPSSESPKLKPLDEDSSPGVSPKTIVHRASDLQINSPPQSSENGSESAPSPSGTIHCPMPIALVPRYQLTTADTFAYSVPINDSYSPLDHWQWMASLWRACVGPDITVYIRDCENDELERLGGNPVEVRLQDARTIGVRRAIGSPRELEEKALKRVGFEIEDYLTQ